MGNPFSGGFAAGAGADALETLLARLFTEGQAKIRNAQESKRLAQEDRRMSMMDADRAERLKDLSDMREQAAVKGILTMTPKGTSLTPDIAARGRAAGFGSQIEHETADLPSTALSGIASVGAKAPIMGQLRMSAAGRPERDTFTGTAEQIADEQRREDAIRTRMESAAERAAARDDQQLAAAEMQRERLDSQRALAQIAAQGRNANADLQRQLLQGRIDDQQAKADEKTRAADTARNAALSSIDETASAVDELIDAQGNLKPGVGGAFGIDAVRGYIPGTGAADAKARIERLTSRLAIDLLGEMKRQSRTGASGFGSLTEKELAVIQNAAARLQSSQSDESARQALVDVRKDLAAMRGRAAGGGAAPAKPPAGESIEHRVWRVGGKQGPEPK